MSCSNKCVLLKSFTGIRQLSQPNYSQTSISQSTVTLPSDHTSHTAVSLQPHYSQTTVTPQSHDSHTTARLQSDHSQRIGSYSEVLTTVSQPVVNKPVTAARQKTRKCYIVLQHWCRGTTTRRRQERVQPSPTHHTPGTPIGAGCRDCSGHSHLHTLLLPSYPPRHRGSPRNDG